MKAKKVANISSLVSWMGRVAQSVVSLTQEPEAPVPYFRFSFR